MFTIKHENAKGRRCVLRTRHGNIETPFFLPVATAGAMKGINLDDLETLGAQVLLCNTYHLHVDPGEETVQKAGDLHAFIGWDKPILTDSGGYQVFSLRGMSKISDEGVHFRHHRSGEKLFLGPEDAMRIQHALGSDIIMCFDECLPSTAPRIDQMKAVDRTLTWAKVCKEMHEKMNKRAGGQEGRKKIALRSPLLFGIVQGGLEQDLRKKCTEELIAIGFDGYAIGGLAVGESEEDMLQMLEVVAPILPKDAPHYLMGVGDIKQMKKAITLGIDMFDCVAPMREARHGMLWLTSGEKIRISRQEYKQDFMPVDAGSSSPLSKKHSRAYLHHLMSIGERYGETIACMQNMATTLKTMQRLRSELEETQKNPKH